MGIKAVKLAAVAVMALSQTTSALPQAKKVVTSMPQSIATLFPTGSSGYVWGNGDAFSTGTGMPASISSLIASHTSKISASASTTNAPIHARASDTTISKSVGGVSLKKPQGKGNHPHPPGSEFPTALTRGTCVPSRVPASVSSVFASPHGKATARGTAQTVSATTQAPSVIERALPSDSPCGGLHTSMPASISSFFAQSAEGSGRLTSLPSDFPISCFSSCSPTGVPPGFASNRPSDTPTGKPSKLA